MRKVRTCRPELSCASLTILGSCAFCLGAGVGSPRISSSARLTTVVARALVQGSRGVTSPRGTHCRLSVDCLASSVKEVEARHFPRIRMGLGLPVISRTRICHAVPRARCAGEATAKLASTTTAVVSGVADVRPAKVKLAPVEAPLS